MKFFVYSLILSIIPLLIGTSLYAFWLVTGDENLILLGVFLLPLCVLFFMAGLIGLPFVARSLKKRQDPKSKQKIIALIACLMLNFPVAFGIIWHVDYHYSFYEINVINQSDEDIQSLHITDPAGRTQTLPKVAAHSALTKKLSLRGEGSVRYHVILREVVREGILIGYITSDLRPYGASLTITPDGDIEIAER